jgi:H+/Cl- antiporter ClcA
MRIGFFIFLTVLMTNYEQHHLRRYFQDRGVWWTASRQTVAWRWFLVLLTGVLVAVMGAFVQVITGILFDWKFRISQNYINDKKLAVAFFSFFGFSMLYSFLAGCLCLFEPAAAGSGIPEIKAYLNGVNLDSVVRLRVLYTKVLGMCLSVASGLPLGKEGPMIHAGSIIGAAVSQGNTITFGFDTSWTKFQDLRNDRSKRDFVTFGAAAGKHEATIP